MADITMCNGHSCPIKDNCYRYKATPSQFLQSYFISEPYDHEKKECDYFWEKPKYSVRSCKKPQDLL